MARARVTLAAFPNTDTLLIRTLYILYTGGVLFTVQLGLPGNYAGIHPVRVLPVLHRCWLTDCYYLHTLNVKGPSVCRAPSDAEVCEANPSLSLPVIRTLSSIAVR